MILRTRLVHLFLSIFVFSSLTAAWPWPQSFQDIGGLIYRRQDDSKNDKPSSSAAESNADSVKPTKKPSPVSRSKGGSAAATSGDSAAASGTAAATTGDSAAASKTGGSAVTTDVDPRLPAGGVNMLTPSPLETTYYKIGDTVTFAWNYTSLSVHPSKVDVIVSCTANSATYTLSNNVSFASTGKVLWDTQPDASGTAPLLTETYTLIVHDAEKDISAVPQAGHLGSYNQFYFGMYVRQEYTPRSEWRCPDCNGALSDTERQALKFMFGMCTVTILSFTWFVGGLGAFI